MDYTYRLEDQPWYSQDEPEPDPAEPLDDGTTGAAEIVDDDEQEIPF